MDAKNYEGAVLPCSTLRLAKSPLFARGFPPHGCPAPRRAAPGKGQTAEDEAKRLKSKVRALGEVRVSGDGLTAGRRASANVGRLRQRLFQTLHRQRFDQVAIKARRCG